MLSTNTIIFLNYFRSAVDFFVINPKALAIKSQLYLFFQHCKIGAWMSEKEEMKKAVGGCVMDIWAHMYTCTLTHKHLVQTGPECWKGKIWPTTKGFSIHSSADSYPEAS